jgi:hypothetical protein
MPIAIVFNFAPYYGCRIKKRQEKIINNWQKGGGAMNRICHCSGTLTAVVAIITLLGGTQVQAVGGIVEYPKDTAPDRYVYYPCTEALDADEIRIAACGTGMPKSTG